MFAPLVAWRDSGLVVDTDFTSLIQTWQTVYGELGYLYDAEAPILGVALPASPVTLALAPCLPNPIRDTGLLRFSLAREAHVRMVIFDISGREVAVLADGMRPAGDHTVRWDASRAASGAYLCRLEEVRQDGQVGPSQTRKLIVVD